MSRTGKPSRDRQRGWLNTRRQKMPRFCRYVMEKSVPPLEDNVGVEQVVALEEARGEPVERLLAQEVLQRLLGHDHPAQHVPHPVQEHVVALS